MVKKETSKERHARQKRNNPKEEAAKQVIRQKERRNKHPEKMAAQNRNRHLKRKYNITSEEFDQMILDQGNVCAGCGKPFIMVKSHNEPLAPVSDHIVVSGKIVLRGILHKCCNDALAHAHDDPEVLRRLADYLCY